MAETTFVYQCFDAQENLLYVGMTSSCERRMKQHEANSSWHRDMATYTAESFDSREEAALCEKNLIKSMKPMHNKGGLDMVKMTLKGDTPEAQTARATIQRKFLSNISTFLNLKTQAQLARVMNEQTSMISKWMNGRLEVTGSAIIHTHEITGWSIEEIKQMLGLPIAKRRV